MGKRCLCGSLFLQSLEQTCRIYSGIIVSDRSGEMYLDMYLALYLSGTSVETSRAVLTLRKGLEWIGTKGGLLLSLSLSHTHTHACAHTHVHAHAHWAWIWGQPHDKSVALVTSLCPAPLAFPEPPFAVP